VGEQGPRATASPEVRLHEATRAHSSCTRTP
jgi:hypothetical protein